MYENLQKPKRKKDWLLPVCLAVAVFVITPILVLIIRSGKTHYDFNHFKVDLAHSFVYAENNDCLKAVIQDEEVRVSRYNANSFYETVLNAGAGAPQKGKAIPEEEPGIHLEFGDGCTMDFWETAIDEWWRVEGPGVFVLFTYADGKIFVYDTDQLSYRTLAGFSELSQNQAW